MHSGVEPTEFKCLLIREILAMLAAGGGGGTDLEGLWELAAPPAMGKKPAVPGHPILGKLGSGTVPPTGKMGPSVPASSVVNNPQRAPG